MKLIILILSIVSTSVIACPNLAGNYLKCTSAITGQTLGMTNVKVTQTLRNNVNVYTINYKEETEDGTTRNVTDVYVANNKPVVTEVEGDYQVHTTTSCDGDKLKVTEELTLGDAPMGYAEGEILKFQDQLQIDYLLVDGNGESERHSISCK